MPQRSRNVMLVLSVAVNIGVIVWGCSGPQPLAQAIRAEDREAFLPRMQSGIHAPKRAYFEWKAEQTSQTVEQVAEEDASLSTTRNPFQANRDHQAVSRGAIIYQVHCATCHGESAEGKGPGMVYSTPRMGFHSFDKRFAATLHGGAPRAWFKKINEGFASEVTNPDGSHSSMPAFGDVLAREQIWLAITYLQSLDMYASASQPAS